MFDVQIVGIYLVKNEELYFNQVIANTHDFCDRLIVADNHSVDSTHQIAENWVKKSDKVELYLVDTPIDAHQFVRPYCNTKTWVFAVDGDEIYDPAGLSILKSRLRSGTFEEFWSLYGNVLNCVYMDFNIQRAKGYLAPPCRSMTKLFNFNAIYDWTDCTPERMHGGHITFKKGWDKNCKKHLHKEMSWEDSFFRCLHLCFLQRSKIDTVDRDGLSIRQNPVELQHKGLRVLLGKLVKFFMGRKKSSDYKREKYMRGDIIDVDCSAFSKRINDKME